MRATDKIGLLKEIPGCYLRTKSREIKFRSLPEIGDQKDAGYTDETLPGRSMPTKIYSGGGSRTISISFNLYAFNQSELEQNYKDLRAIQSSIYPLDGTGADGIPYEPPPLSYLKCGDLISKDEVCGVIKDYNVKFPTNVPWSTSTETRQYLPYKIEISLNFEVTYSSALLPGQEFIFNS